MLSLLKGVTLKLSLGRMGQELAVPIMLSRHICICLLLVLPSAIYRHLTLKAAAYGALTYADVC
jgi:hypothetical protein